MSPLWLSCAQYNLERLQNLPETKGCVAKARTHRAVALGASPARVRTTHAKRLIRPASLLSSLSLCVAPRLPPTTHALHAQLRMKEKDIYVTDNGNYIIDLYFETPMKDAVAAGKAISELVGVVEHGLFLNMCDVCIIAGKTGIEVKERKLKR